MEGKSPNKRAHARDRKFGSLITLLSTAAVAFVVSACGAGQDAGAGGGTSLGRRSLPSADTLAGDTEELTVAIHYLAFKDGNGQAVTNRSQVEAMVNHMSDIWAQCHIDYKLEDYQEVDPQALGARLTPANYAELDSMREAAQSDNFVTMIGTGAWDRTGDLGDSGSNCYSSFPGDKADGIVCEQSQASSPSLHAHEVGHWFNLLHTDDPNVPCGIPDVTPANAVNDVMNHMVAPDNTFMTPGQCSAARRAIGQWRRNAVI